MPQTSFAMMTATGRAREAAALAGNTTVQITHIAIGDGATIPAGGETQLYHEVARKPITGSGTVAGAANVAWFDIFLAAAEGPYTIREAGLIASNGDLIAIAHYDPPINKPVPASGQTVEGTVRLEVAFSDVTSINVVIDPTLQVTIQRLTVTPFIPVSSMTTTAPPGAPSAGDIYLIPAGATGAWAGQANKLAEYTSAGWAIVAARNGHGIGLPDGSIWIKVAGVYVQLASRPMRAMGLWADLAVKSVQNAPPGAPAAGDVHIVGTAGAGAWAAQSNKIAMYVDGGWTFMTPPAGLQANYKSGTKFVAMWFDGAAWRTLNSLNVITAPTTLNINPAGAASPVNPLGGDAFDSLASLMTWLADWSITGGGSVSIQYSAGVHTMTTPLAIAHPNANKISIAGAALPGAFPNYATDVVATVAASRANLRAKMGTVIELTGTASIMIAGGIASLSNLMIDQNGSSDTFALGIRAGSMVISNMVLFGAAGGNVTKALSVTLNASVVATNTLLVAHSDAGISVRQGGDVTLGATTISKYCRRGLDIAGGGANAGADSTLLVTQAQEAALSAGTNGTITATGTVNLSGDNLCNTRSYGGQIVLEPSTYASGAVTSSYAHQAARGGQTRAPNMGAVTCSPAAGTVGNANSFIELT